MKLVAWKKYVGAQILYRSWVPSKKTASQLFPKWLDTSICNYIYSCTLHRYRKFQLIRKKSETWFEVFILHEPDWFCLKKSLKTRSWLFEPEKMGYIPAQNSKFKTFKTRNWASKFKTLKLELVSQNSIFKTLKTHNSFFILTILRKIWIKVIHIEKQVKL